MKFDEAGFFRHLQNRGLNLDPGQKERIITKIEEVLSYEPKIGFFGKTGVGKSSLCNALFGKDVCPISDVEACTRHPQEVLINLSKNGIKLIDVPGVGETNERDKEYARLYAELLPEIDVILWIVKADDRAFSSDERFYKQIVRPHFQAGKPFFVVINQVDKIEPFRNWNENENKPGPDQTVNINKKIEHMGKIFELPKSKIIPVSANEKYNLVSLIDEIIFSLPKDKKVTFADKVKKDNVSDNAKKNAESGFWDTVWDIVEKAIPVIGSFVGSALNR